MSIVAAKEAILERHQRDLTAMRAEVVRLRAAIAEACDLLAERTHGNPARSPGHNARLRLEVAIAVADDGVRG